LISQDVGFVILKGDCNKILNNSDPEDHSLISIQKLLLSSVAERDISAQETCHLLLSISLYHSSRSFVSLNLSEKAPRWIREMGSKETTGDAGRTTQSPLKKYWNRPEEFEEYLLFKLYLTHNIIKGIWKKCKKENIVRILL
jgi:ATP-dependent DNA helicase PIF1